MIDLQQSQPQKIQITPEMIKNFKTVTCCCGGVVFENALVLKKISALISPTGKEELYPMEILVCRKCGKVPEELNVGNMLPEEIVLKTLKP